MLSDVSSLTDISSDDDSFVPVNKAKKSTKKGEYVLRGSLKAYRTVQYSAKHLYEEILEGRIDLDPEYQRDVVWQEVKQIGLIDSILRNFYIPPVIFAVTMTDDGEEKRTCIDGKQRLTSIQRFMDGMIPYRDPRTTLKLWYKHRSSNPSGKLLPQKYRQQFASKQIVCVEYADISDDAEREIFQRVQLGVALTPAERMQAIPGPWCQLVREVLDLMEQYNIGDHLDWAGLRGRPFQNVATAIHIIEKGTGSAPSAPVLEKWLQRVTPPSQKFKERVVDTFAVFRYLVLTKKHSSIFRKAPRVAPVEFVMCAVLIDKYMNTSSLAQLISAIEKMRADVRSKHADIRSNTKVMKTLHSFVFERFPQNLKKAEGEKPALQVVRSSPAPAPAIKKRKRGSPSNDSESNSSDGSEPLKAKTSPFKKAARTVSGAGGASGSASSPKASSSKLATGTPMKKPTSSANNASTMPTPVVSKDRLAAMRAAKATVIQTPAGSTSGPANDRTSLPRAPSRQGTDMHPPPPPYTSTPGNSGGLRPPSADGVDITAVQSAIARYNPQQLPMSVSQWPPHSPTLAQGQGPGSGLLHQPQQGVSSPLQGISNSSSFTQNAMQRVDPRLNLDRSGSSTPAHTEPPSQGSQPTPPLHSLPPRPLTINDPSDITQRMTSRPSQFSQRYDDDGAGGSGSSRFRESRFDRQPNSASSAAGFRDTPSVSPRQPPSEPRRLSVHGQGPNGRGRGGPNQRRDNVLNGYGSISGRDNGWRGRGQSNGNHPYQ